MVVNEFQLPETFVRLCEDYRRGGMPWEWALKENVDAYGHPWHNHGLRIYTNPEEIAEETRDLHRLFREQQKFPHLNEARNAPGFIHDFAGVGNYVQLGTSPTGEVYCFDFGGDPREPSVVYWSEGGYWRRVAPNFTSFIALFVDEVEVLHSQEDDEDEEEGELPARILLRNWVPLYVMGAPAASQRSFFAQLVSAYAEIGPEERQEVEAEVRQDLKKYEAGGMKMTEEHRGRLETVWQRLRASLPS